MARIPTHTIEDAPAAARPLLAEMIQFSPTGQLLNMYAQRAHAPAVPDQAPALLASRDPGGDKLDTLAAAAREAAADSGRVSNPTWQAAADRGRDNEQLAEAFAYLGPAVFTSYFLNYAATIDVPAGPARAGEGA